ncbi:unnamed protein product [Paramecium primaurelia]|uniref:non-specific serine/threonine protein kinase n=1 Tax=Paramecium primaurelia TaxID=5886 RepID=A0A8S1QLY5_PARPR|nr:unnamed protein product [Paramecium primaurelia]
MGNGQSNQNNHGHMNEQPEQQQIINSSVALRSQVVKKRNISQDDDDDDEDDEEEELDSNDDSENEEQQSESNEYEEYIQGDKLVDNKSMYSGFLVNRIQLLAIKKIVLNKKENFKIIKYNLQQLTNLRHQNLETIISWNFENSNNKKNYYLNIFSNFQSNGSLQSILLKYCKFSKELILTIFQSILKALEYLHSQNKLHKNLKTQNILVDHEGTILISDILIQSQYSLSNYSAPETFVYADYSEASDIWSAGCIFYELLTQKQPWQINDKVLSIQEIKKKFSLNQTFLKENLDIQKNAMNILQQIFQFQPENRPSASQLLKHQIFLENSTSKFKQMAKQISQKDVQNTPQKKFMSLIQDCKINNNSNNIQLQPVQYIKLKKKEDDEISFDIKECVFYIQSNILKEFTITQNSNSYLLTKNNFDSLTIKQHKFNCNLIQQKLCHNKQQYRIQDASNLSQIVSQMKTAINLQGSILQSQNSTSEKNFDQKSFQANHLILQTQSFNQLNQEIKQFQQIQDNQNDIKQKNEQITKQQGLIKSQTQSTINQNINSQDTEQILFDGDFVFIL